MTRLMSHLLDMEIFVANDESAAADVCPYQGERRLRRIWGLNMTRRSKADALHAALSGIGLGLIAAGMLLLSYALSI